MSSPIPHYVCQFSRIFYFLAFHFLQILIYSEEIELRKLFSGKPHCCGMQNLGAIGSKLIPAVFVPRRDLETGTRKDGFREEP